MVWGAGLPSAGADGVAEDEQQSGHLDGLGLVLARLRVRLDVGIPNEARAIDRRAGLKERFIPARLFRCALEVGVALNCRDGWD